MNGDQNPGNTSATSQPTTLAGRLDRLDVVVAFVSTGQLVVACMGSVDTRPGTDRHAGIRNCSSLAKYLVRGLGLLGAAGLLRHDSTSGIVDAAWFMLFSYLSLYPLMFIWISRKMVHGHGVPLLIATPVVFTGPRMGASSRVVRLWFFDVGQFPIPGASSAAGLRYCRCLRTDISDGNALLLSLFLSS